MFPWSDYITMFIGLLAIVDPLGAVPIFLGLTQRQDAARQRATARQAAITAAITLLVAAWIGEWLLQLFGIGIPSFRVGGGILILLMAISMLYASPSSVKHGPHEAAEARETEALGVVPIGVPLLAGPGAIALVIVGAHQHPGMTHLGILTGMILLVCAGTWAALALAAAIGNRIGRTGINIVERLMGLILAAIAVELIAQGVRELFPALA